MSLTPEQIEELRLAGSKWATQELRPKDPLNPGLATDPNARVPYPAEAAWSWTLLPDQVDQVRDAINALLTGMVNALEANDSVNQALEGKEASGTAQSLVDALSDSVNQALEGKEASGTAQSLVDALSQAMAEALQDKEASGTAQDLVDSLSQAFTEALVQKETAGAAQSLFDSLGLGQISSTKDLTPVDIFIYDTKNDSDGGAWRKRCQGTSWYQEDLNTAIRGSRREFPSVAVILAEASKLTIYDADYPELSMWAVFNTSTSYTQTLITFGSSGRITAVCGLNGCLCVTTTSDPSNSGTNGTFSINFVSDSAIKHSQSQGSRGFGSVISDRNTSNVNNYLEGAVYPSIASNFCNDVAMTVLPESSIEMTTGLPVVTIGVFTDSGVSIINGPAGAGTAVNWIPVGIGTVGYGSISSAGIWISCGGGISFKNYFLDSIPVTHSSAAPDYIFDQVSNPARLGFNANTGMSDVVRTDDYYATASNQGLGEKGLNLLHFGHSMVAYITSKYNTGWMVGDTKLCALCSTDTSDLVGSELVTNGEFDTDVDGWTPSSGFSLTHSSGSMNLAYDGAGGLYYVGAVQHVSTVIGNTYIFSYEVVSINGGLLRARVENTLGGGEHLNSNQDVGVYYHQFVASSTITIINLCVQSDIAMDVTVDNISVRPADHDRSVNNNGLVLHGTVQRSPVAVGSELVAYSGFSSSDYLEQPHNSDLDFGTGDFSVMAWAYGPSAGNETIVLRDNSPNSSSGYGFYFSSGQIAYQCGSSAALTDGNIYAGHSRFIALVRKDGNAYIYVDGELIHSASRSGDTSDGSSTLRVGLDHGGSRAMLNPDSWVAEVRISATAPTADQIKKIYNDEKHMFQEGAQSTLYGSSDAVLAIDHDNITGTLHAGTSHGRSEFDGLVRVSNTTESTSVISAHDGLVVEA